MGKGTEIWDELLSSLKLKEPTMSHKCNGEIRGKHVSEAIIVDTRTRGRKRIAVGHECYSEDWEGEWPR